jgi:antitoxin component of MazEF toxin-antitoxin module
MEKTLTVVGNSKAVILPAQMVKKLGGDKVIIEETEDGILIKTAVKSSFQKAVDKMRKNKAAIYKRIEIQASDPETIKYYSNPSNNFADLDTEIIER